MAKQKTFRIPERHVDDVLGFLAMAPDERTRLLNALSDAPSCLTSKDLISEVSSALGRPGREVEGPIVVMMSLYNTRLAMKIELGNFIKVLKEEIEPWAQKKGIDSIDWDSIEKDLSRIAEMHQPLGATAKASELQTEYERVFLDARILSDIRTVFAPDLSEKPTVSLIIHNLRISYSQDGRTRNCHFALDSDDILQLQKELERAVEKEHTLQDLLDSARICWLGGAEND